MTTLKRTKPKLKLLLFLLLFTSASTFTLFSCSSPTQPPQKNNGILTLSLEEVSSTEAWVKLKVQNVPLPAEINFLLDSKTLTNINLASADTTLYIDSLLPNRSYRLEARFTDNTGTASSNLLTVQTLDTTSHNFTWQIFTFGDAGAGSSVLNDVAIIDENNIWAVGEIYMNDSTGKPDPRRYNAVHWDGSNWEVKRITTEFRGNLITVPLEGIYAFSATDIWMVGSLPIHGDGKSWTMYDVRTTTDPNLSLSKAWGSNSNDMYFVGRSGSIAHLNGSPSGAGWQKIESGTTTRLNDIWGYYDRVNNNLSVMTVASNVLHQGETRLLAVSGNSAKDTLNWPYSNWLNGIWFKGEYSPVYVSGSGIRQYKFGKWSTLNLSNIFTQKIRGTDLNNIMAVGDFGIIFHYNGVGWAEIDDYLYQYKFLSVAIKGNMVALVGFNTSGGIVGKAVVIIGRH